MATGAAVEVEADGCNAGLGAAMIDRVNGMKRGLIVMKREEQCILLKVRAMVHAALIQYRREVEKVK